MKRVLVLMAVGVILLSGCLSRKSNGKEERVEEPVRLVLLAGVENVEERRAAFDSFVERVNGAQNGVELTLELVEAEKLSAELKVRLDEGRAPDLVGPFEPWLLKRYSEEFVELASESVEPFSYDERVLELYSSGEGGRLSGLPLTIEPSFIFYNKTLFDEAGLSYPPRSYGQDYVDENGVSHPWNLETLRTLAMKLTLDQGMTNALSRGFRGADIIQFGFSEQGTGALGFASLFGPGSLIDEEGRAAIPEHWREGWKWFYRAMWEDRFHPSGKYHGYRYLGRGDYFRTGNVAMTHTGLSYAFGEGLRDLDWGLAALPSYNGRSWARLDSKGLAILKSGQEQEQLLKGAAILLRQAELYELLGGMPALKEMQTPFLEDFLGASYPALEPEWQVVLDSQSHAVVPHYRGELPNPGQAERVVDGFWGKCRNEPDLDLDFEIDRFEQFLQRIFDKVK